MIVHVAFAVNNTSAHQACNHVQIPSASASMYQVCVNYSSKYSCWLLAAGRSQRTPARKAQQPRSARKGSDVRGGRQLTTPLSRGREGRPWVRAWRHIFAMLHIWRHDLVILARRAGHSSMLKCLM